MAADTAVRVCAAPGCSNPLPANAKGRINPKRRACSKSCANLILYYRHRPRPTTCGALDCSNPLPVTERGLPFANRDYCSDTCRHRAYRLSLQTYPLRYCARQDCRRSLRGNTRAYFCSKRCHLADARGVPDVQRRCKYPDCGRPFTPANRKELYCCKAHRIANYVMVKRVTGQNCIPDPRAVAIADRAIHACPECGGELESAGEFVICLDCGFNTEHHRLKEYAA